MRQLALVVVGIVVAVSSTAAAQSGEPEGAEFVDRTAGETFAIPSGGTGWTVKGKPARVLRVDRPVNPQSSAPRDRQGLAVLWAPSCTTRKQTVVVQRKVFLAGPEWKLGAAIDMVHSAAGRLTSAELRVNGIRVVRVGRGGGGFDQTAARPRVFRFGLNTIEVTAVKAASPRRCNRTRTARDMTGVRFVVFGEFASDIALPEQLPAIEYRRLEEGTFGVGVPLEFEVRNNGPGGLARVPLNVMISVPVTGEPSGTLLQVTNPQPPVRSCTAIPAAGVVATGQRSINCTIDNLPPGGTARQGMKVNFFLPPSGLRAQVFIRWGAFVEQPAGANPTDNERTKTIWLCRFDDASCPAP